MNPAIVRSALLVALVVATCPLSATSSELLRKCGDHDGRTDHLVFVPIPDKVEGAEYTPRVALLPRSTAWRAAARPEFSEVGPPAARMAPLYLIDGKIVDGPDAYREVASEIEAIYISCSDVAVEALGLEAGHTMVVAFTYPVLDILQEEMKAIETKQADFLQVNNRFADSLKELGWDGSEQWIIEMTLTDDGNGWEAVGRHVLLDERNGVTVSGTR